jgi:hypothetical protein
VTIVTGRSVFQRPPGSNVFFVLNGKRCLTIEGARTGYSFRKMIEKKTIVSEPMD